MSVPRKENLQPTTSNVLQIVVTDAEAGQRLDNYLMKRLKGVPKSYIYRIIRSGEVRISGGRVAVDHRLREGTIIRIPPVRTAAPAMKPAVLRLEEARRFTVLYEDEALLAIDKPAGVAVHGGSGISRGVIEHLRFLRPEARFLELAHRLDRDTSGLLLLAKKRSALVALHTAFRCGEIKKKYKVFARGRLPQSAVEVKAPLYKYMTASGERRVRVCAEHGQSARTIFGVEQCLSLGTLLNANLKTGRTHQIRVHLAYLGCPVAADDKYGDRDFNEQLSTLGLKRMFLHAISLEFNHPLSGGRICLHAPLPTDLSAFLERLAFL